MSQPTQPQNIDHNEPDVHSFAKPEEAIITHIHLNLNVDFDKHLLMGFAKINFNFYENIKCLFV